MVGRSASVSGRRQRRSPVAPSGLYRPDEAPELRHDSEGYLLAYRGTQVRQGAVRWRQPAAPAAHRIAGKQSKDRATARAPFGEKCTWRSRRTGHAGTTFRPGPVLRRRSGRSTVEGQQVVVRLPADDDPPRPSRTNTTGGRGTLL